jgi:hypothetical protein
MIARLLFTFADGQDVLRGMPSSFHSGDGHLHTGDQSGRREDGAVPVPCRP